MTLLLALIVVVAGAYSTLLGLGKVDKPAQWKQRDEMLWIGRFALFFGALLFLDGCGITPHQISSWLEDILTSGGGMGTG